jgi:glycosyltransferase involved in cell wall biosynthesis
MKILFIAPYPAGESPSQRYRMEHYLPYLKEHNISFSYKPFIEESTWKVLFQKGHPLKKIWGFGVGFLKRFFQIFSLYRYNYIYIHREATPVGPPFFEWIAAKVFKKKIIYDFDDAIWIPFSSENNKLASRLKNFGKVANICRWSYKVSVGNEYLGDFARKYNSSVIVIPTVVNTSEVHNQLQDQQTLIPSIGWTGTFSTLKYLDIVLPVLQELQAKYPFKFIVIADKDPKLPLQHYRFTKWSRDKEAEDLLQFHIGLMPLYDDEISKGKCGFKAIQYMSLGIPAVVSPVGVNSIIVDDTISGFVCHSSAEWKDKLELLLNNSKLRASMGVAARKKIEKAYSVTSSTRLFLNLFS